jgi:hypothetical protein
VAAASRCEDYSHQARLYRKPLRLCFASSGLYEFFVATIPRLGRCFLFSCSLGSLLVSYFCLHTLSNFRFSGNGAQGTTGALTREASKAAKLFIAVDQGFPSMRSGQDEHAKKAGTDRRRVYRGNRGCFRWSKTAVVNDTFVKHGMTDWTRRKRNVEIL